MTDEPRDRATRTADTLAMLASERMDVWVATASPTGRPHLVPLSLAWIDDRVVVAVTPGSATGRNLADSGFARLGVGPTRDVVMIEATVDRTVDVNADAALAQAYAAQADWDPRGDGGFVFVVLRPDRVQAWRESNEIAGRELMRDGRWLA